MPLIETVKADLRRDEGRKLKVYRCTSGKLTIGIGRNLEDKGITVSEAEYLLDNDVHEILADLDRLLPWWRTLAPDQQRGLINMAFQLGMHGLLQFRRTLAALQAGEAERAAALALESKWARQTPSRAHRVAHLLARG